MIMCYIRQNIHMEDIMITTTDTQKKIEKRLLSGESIRKIAGDLKIPRSQVKKQADQLKGANSKKIGFYTVLAIILITSMIWFFMAKAKKSTQPERMQQTKTQELWFKNFKSVCHQILVTKAEDEWLIETEKAKDENEIPKIAKLSEQIASKVELGLQNNSSIPEVGKLNKVFGNNLRVSYFDNTSGGTIQFSTRNSTELVSTELNKQEITIYSKQSASNARINDHPLFYDKGWGSLIIAAIKWDPVWLQAVSLHELYHAKMYIDNTPSSISPPMSDLYIEEEIVAHNIEHNVLNLQTTGKYNDVIQRIVDSKNADSQKELMKQITEDDIIKIDSLFGAAGSREVGIRLTQYYFSLLNNWVDNKKFNKEKTLQEKIDNYRLIVSTGDSYGS